MLNKKVEEALNAQINAEMWSAYLYLSMAAYCHANGNPGMGNWFQVQFQEEQDHAKIMFNYIIQRGGHVELKAIDAVPTTWENPLDVFESTLAHEQKVTSLINNLFALTTQENDYATQSMLKWFVDEQVEGVTACIPNIFVGTAMPILIYYMVIGLSNKYAPLELGPILPAWVYFGNAEFLGGGIWQMLYALAYTGCIYFVLWKIAARQIIRRMDNA